MSHATTLRTIALTLALCIAPALARAQSFALDPLSSSLPIVPAGSNDVLQMSIPGGPAAGPLPPPAVGLSAANLGLLPGDVIDALSFSEDLGVIGVDTLYFSVDRLAVSAPGPFPPDVFSEVAAVPPLIQGEAASDIFSTFDAAAGVPPGTNTQVIDGNGIPLVPPVIYPGWGLGLSELNPLPGPPLTDDISAFDWAQPGRMTVYGAMFSLAAGSPSLTPGTNPLLLAGAEPGDILFAGLGQLGTAGPAAFVGVGFPAVALGLVSGGPGCAPPACDDIDALAFGAGINFSVSPASPTAGVFGAGAVLTTGPALVLPPGALGLGPLENVDALELVANPCPVPPAFDAPDFDGLGGCDNCPVFFNPGQEDSDFDGIGDFCDPCTDLDGDGAGDPGFSSNMCANDNCVYTSNPLQTNSDGDAFGDACDNCPLVINISQTDTDFDGVGNACDLCPTVFDPSNADTDGDLFGDACDPCTGGIATTKPQVKMSKLGSPGLEKLQVKGTGAFPGAAPVPPIEAQNDGLRVQLIDLGAGNAVLFDHTIPAGLVPTVCGPTDGWTVAGGGTTQKYANATNALPPACVASSAVGIYKAQVKDKTASLKGVGHKVQGKDGNYGPVVGPLRVTVVYGGAPEGAGGQCAEHTFAPANCTFNGSGTSFKCK